MSVSSHYPAALVDPSIWKLIYFRSLFHWWFLPPVKWSESRSVVSDSLQPHGLYSSWNSPGRNTRVGSLSLLQEICPTQESTGLPHGKQILYQLSHQGMFSPFSSPPPCLPIFFLSLCLSLSFPFFFICLMLNFLFWPSNSLIFSFSFLFYCLRNILNFVFQHIFWIFHFYFHVFNLWELWSEVCSLNVK